MGSIFDTPGLKPTYQPRSKRQVDYLRSKKTNRGHNKRTEESLQIKVSNYLREMLPEIHFNSDTGAGAFNSRFAKNTHNKQQSAKGLPDMTIHAGRKGYHSLMLELKPEGTKLKLTRDSKVTKVYKDSKGKIIARDLRPRLKGEWKDFYIERQHQRHEELRKEKNCALFVVGYDQAIKVINWYFDIKSVEPVSLF